MAVFLDFSCHLQTFMPALFQNPWFLLKLKLMDYLLPRFTTGPFHCIFLYAQKTQCWSYSTQPTLHVSAEYHSPILPDLVLNE